MMEKSVTAFVSYAHEDEDLRQMLEKHLSGLRRQGLIEDWHDRQIMPGTDWAQDINEHLDSASVILLLISSSFIASDYCYDIEMQRALERHKRGEVRVIPILLQSCDWRHTPFAHLQCLPHGGKPVTKWDNLDEAFADIAQGVRQVIEQQQVSDHLLTKVERQNRVQLLKRVHRIWVQDYLAHPLHQSARFDLQLQEQPDALENPWRFQVQELDQDPRPLPVGTSIIQVYDEADGGLLILGDPGAGKTTQLVDLARMLLKRAEQDANHPIPVIFNLSSWAQKQQSLDTWLIEELGKRYRVRPEIGQRLIETNQILPLLDGLDEVARRARFACVEAIVSYYQNSLEQKGIPLVICCRRLEYVAISTHLPLSQAVNILPLTQEQVDQYLYQAGSQLRALREAIQADSELAKLARRPLILCIFALAYQNATVVDLPAQATEEATLRAAFATYLDQMLKRRGKVRTGTEKQFRHWLTYLAWQMHQQEQPIFLVEELQPDWLPDKHKSHPRKRDRSWKKSRLLFPLFYGLFFGVLVGVLVGFLDGLVVGLFAGLVEGILGGHFIGGINGLVHKKGRRPEGQTHQQEQTSYLEEGFQPNWPPNKQEDYTRQTSGLLSPAFAGLLLGVIIGLLIGLLVGLVAGLYLGPLFALVNGILGGLVGGIFGGLFGGFDGFIHRKGRKLDSFIGEQDNVPDTNIRPVENVTWSWKFTFTRQRLVTGLLGVVGFGVGAWLTSGLYGAISLVLTFVVIFWLINCFSTGQLAEYPIRFPNEGITDQLAEHPVRTPNEGIWRSGKNGLVAGLLAGIVGGLVYGIGTGVGTGISIGIGAGIDAGIFGGLYFMLTIGLDAGLDAFIRHFLLRFLLWRSGTLPWKLIPFLDEAVERLLLYQVDGSYIFVHRLLLDYLASLRVSSLTMK